MVPDNEEALAAPQGDSSGATNAQASESTSGTSESPGGTGGADCSLKSWKLTDEEKICIVQSLKNGVTPKHLMEHYKVSRGAIAHLIKTRGVIRDPLYMGSWKMSREKKLELKKEYIDGETVRALSNKYNISRSCIRKLLVRMGINIRKYNPGNITCDINHTIFDVIDEQSAYWIGFLMADGYIIQHGNSYKIGVSLSSVDIEHIKKFRSFLESTHSITHNTKRNMDTICVSSQHIARRLIDLGVTPRKSLSAKVSKDLELNINFWRGVVDGDGSILYQGVHRYPCIKLVGSKYLVEQFSQFACIHVPRCRASVRKSRNIYVFALVGKTAIDLIRILYGNANIYLNRKHDTAMKMIKGV